MSELRRVTVPLPDRSYDVLVGHGAAEFLGTVIPESAKRAAIVTQADVPLEVEANIPHERFEIGSGERYKSLDTVSRLCRDFARMGLTRNDVVIGVGGGMVTDVAGFAAACYHRGVPVVHVATTLLGMVDAAIGGKTGVNLPEGKNLVGAFWQPSGVVCDLDALDTLPERERRCGLGEMAKYHFLTGDDLLSMEIGDRIARCVAIKADVVAADERERGRRAILNYGHTLAHALEVATEHRLAHGEAVAVGLIFAAHLAEILGRIPLERIDEHFTVVGEEYGLATDIPTGLEAAICSELMRRDKKALDGLTFVLDGESGVEVVAGVDDEPVLEALADGPVSVPILTTDRLTLRGWRDDDRAAFHEVNADPAVMATLGPMMTRAQSDAFMNRIVQHFADHGFGVWCVEFEGRVLGYTGFMVPWFRDGVEIGWRIRSDHWGHGIATEAAGECLRHGFGELDFDEIISFTAVTNTRSRRVMEKIGLRYDPAGDFDHPSVPDGDPLQPHVLYRLAEGDWAG